MKKQGYRVYSSQSVIALVKSCLVDNLVFIRDCIKYFNDEILNPTSENYSSIKVWLCCGYVNKFVAHIDSVSGVPD